MASQVVVTFAARYWPDLPELTDEEAIGTGVPVPIADGLTGTMRLGPMMAVKSAPGPDEWRAVVQVVVDIAPGFIEGVAGGLLGNWIWEHVRGKPEAPNVNVDQSVHNEFRVFIGRAEITTPNQDEIAAAVLQALRAEAPTTEIPPQLRRPQAIAAGQTDEEWVLAQMELARQYRADMERLTKKGKLRPRPTTHEEAEPEDQPKG
jgi:hypothetical protein